MVLSNLLRSKIDKKNRGYALLFVVVIELVIGGYVWRLSKPHNILLGFLIKDGSHYVLAWKEEQAGYQSAVYSSLKDALKEAQDLHLAPGRNPISNNDVERVWVQDRFGAYTVFWKTISYSALNKLTFQSHADAVFFEDAFRRGSYTPSPYGHSVLFVPDPRD